MSMFKNLSLILVFSLLAVIFIFSVVFMQQLGDEQILTPIHNMTQQVGAASGISINMQNHIDNQLTEYRAVTIPYDLYFVLIFLFVFSSSVFSAYKTKEEGYLSFFGFITFGLIVFLFIVGFIDVVKDWLIVNLIENFLTFDLTSTPIINFYLLNTAFINLLWAVILVLVNKLNFTNNRDEDLPVFQNANGGFER